MVHKVLLASRLPDQADATVPAAARLAEQIGAELVLVYVAVELSTLPEVHASTGGDPDELRSRMLAEIETRAREYLERSIPGRAARTRILEGDVTDQIARVAAEERADYLVIGTERRSTFRQVILGSTAQKLLHHAPCPVLVVPAAHA